MKKNVILAAAGLALFITSHLFAEAPSYDLADWKIGDIVAGDDVNLEELGGRVVAIEYWGTQ